MKTILIYENDDGVLSFTENKTVTEGFGYISAVIRVDFSGLYMYFSKSLTSMLVDAKIKEDDLSEIDSIYVPFKGDIIVSNDSLINHPLNFSDSALFEFMHTLKNSKHTSRISIDIENSYFK